MEEMKVWNQYHVDRDDEVEMETHEGTFASMEAARQSLRDRFAQFEDLYVACTGTRSWSKVEVRSRATGSLWAEFVIREAKVQS